MPAPNAVLLRAMVTAAIAALASGAAAGPADEVRELYDRFYHAQNDRDLARVRAVLLPSDRFLWVSDGRTYWGPDAVLERMALFQRAPVWRVTPDLERAVAVEVDADTAYLHLPLVLRIGPADQPSELGFLVSVLGTDTDAGWRIAALFTTEAKGP